MALTTKSMAKKKKAKKEEAEAETKSSKKGTYGIIKDAEGKGYWGLRE